jgi:hypothetical protein
MAAPALLSGRYYQLLPKTVAIIVGALFALLAIDLWAMTGWLPRWVGSRPGTRESRFFRTTIFTLVLISVFVLWSSYPVFVPENVGDTFTGTSTF